MTLGEKVKARREQLGWTKTQLADEIGVNRATITKYENGQIKVIGLDKAQELSRVLKISMTELQSDQEDLSKEEQLVTHNEMELVEKMRKLTEKDRAYVLGYIDRSLTESKKNA